MKDVNDVFIAGQSADSTSTTVSSSDAHQRLQQAAHILVNGAIRAAMKQAALKKTAKKPAKPLPSLMSENQTSTEIACESIQESPSKKTCKTPNFGRSAEGAAA